MNGTHPRDSCDEGVEAGGRAHLLRGDDEAAHLLIVSQQNVQMPLDRVEGFGAADVHLCAASVFGHELHEHHDELVDGLVVYARVLRQQISNEESSSAGELSPVCLQRVAHLVSSTDAV